ncbi:MAG: rhodanese-like domain-containing protein [Candidatus Babeliales bacterium]
MRHEIRNSIFVMFGLSTLTLLSSCTWWEEKKDEKAASLIVVNVLSKKYFDDCHIKGSVNIEMDALKDHAEKNWNKAKDQIVLYCGNYMCTASGESARMLKQMGFQHVWAYEGGTAEWKQLDYPVEGVCTAGYLTSFKKPEGYEAEANTPVITSQELKSKMEEFDLL